MAAALPRHPGPVPLLDAAGNQRLLTCFVVQPDALVTAGGPLLSRTTVWRAIERLG